MITLYHGSNVEIEQIDLTCSKRGKDFGCGFYLNANEQQASDMAERTARRLMSGNPNDIVIGPIANDTVGVQIRRYIMGYISIENLIKELRFRGNHAVQYFFGTEKAINLLKKVKV
jgi:hypothetical protein